VVSGSWIAAMTRTGPPHRSHTISISNTRFRSSDQSAWSCCSVEIVDHSNQVWVDESRCEKLRMFFHPSEPRRRGGTPPPAFTKYTTSGAGGYFRASLLRTPW